MKQFFSITLVLLNVIKLSAQEVAVANERMNVFYANVDNPVAIAVDSIPKREIVIRVTVGHLSKQQHGYYFRSTETGTTDIFVYHKVTGKLKLIKKSTFRILAIPPPIFKIGSGKSQMSRVELSNQEFARADLDNFDIDIRFII